MYWTDSGDPAKIERASMDGSSREVLLSGEHIELPIGLAIDYTTRKLYWIDAKLDAIKQSDLDGSNVRAVASQRIDSPVGITLFEDHMYWTDKKKIYKANKFTGKNITELINDAFSPRDLHVFHRQRQPVGKTFTGHNRVLRVSLAHLGNLLFTQFTNAHAGVLQYGRSQIGSFMFPVQAHDCAGDAQTDFYEYGFAH